jgi:hypothetical protein
MAQKRWILSALTSTLPGPSTAAKWGKLLRELQRRGGEIRFTGVTAHPMSAKGVLVNPLLMATDFISHFDRQQTPECTEGREGYIWFNGIQAGQNEAF